MLAARFTGVHVRPSRSRRQRRQRANVRGGARSRGSRGADRRGRRRGLRLRPFFRRGSRSPSRRARAADPETRAIRSPVHRRRRATFDRERLEADRSVRGIGAPGRRREGVHGEDRSASPRSPSAPACDGSRSGRPSRLRGALHFRTTGPSSRSSSAARPSRRRPGRTSRYPRSPSTAERAPTWMRSGTRALAAVLLERVSTERSKGRPTTISAKALARVLDAFFGNRAA